MLNEMQPYTFKGKVEKDFGSISLTVNCIGFWIDAKCRLPVFSNVIQIFTLM